jgi:hypothetical protein
MIVLQIQNANEENIGTVTVAEASVESIILAAMEGRFLVAHPILCGDGTGTVRAHTLRLEFPKKKE